MRQRFETRAKVYECYTANISLGIRFGAWVCELEELIAYHEVYSMGTQGAQTKEDLQPLFLGLSASSLTKYKLYIIIIYYEYYINHLSVPQRTAPSLIELSLLLQETGEIAETSQCTLMVRPKLGFEAIRCSPVAPRLLLS